MGGESEPPLEGLVGVGTWEGEQPVVPRPTQSTWTGSLVGRLCTQRDDLNVALFPYNPAFYSVWRPMRHTKPEEV